MKNPLVISLWMLVISVLVSVTLMYIMLGYHITEYHNADLQKKVESLQFKKIVSSCSEMLRGSTLNEYDRKDLLHRCIVFESERTPTVKEEK